jgi:hypothetical protein
LVDVFEFRCFRLPIWAYVESKKVGGVRPKIFEVDDVDDYSVNKLPMVLE